MKCKRTYGLTMEIPGLRSFDILQAGPSHAALPSCVFTDIYEELEVYFVNSP